MDTIAIETVRTIVLVCGWCGGALMLVRRVRMIRGERPGLLLDADCQNPDCKARSSVTLRSGSSASRRAG